MNVVPSAIFAAVNQVEEAFGLKLVTRSRSKGIHPTATGKLLLTKIRHLLDEYENLLKGGADLKNQLTGTLRVGYYAPIAPAFMPGIARELVRASNSVVVKFIECDNQSAQEGLLTGEYDVIICVAAGMRPEVTYETLLEVPAYLLLARDHALATRKTVSIDRLKDEKLVLLDLPVVAEYYRNNFHKACISPSIVATATTVEMVRSLVGAGVGCSILHMRPLVDISYAGHPLAAIPFHPALKPMQLVMGYLPDNPRRLVQAFTDEMRKYFLSERARDIIVNL